MSYVSVGKWQFYVDSEFQEKFVEYIEKQLHKYLSWEIGISWFWDSRFRSWIVPK